MSNKIVFVKIGTGNLPRAMAEKSFNETKESIVKQSKDNNQLDVSWYFIHERELLGTTIQTI